MLYYQTLAIKTGNINILDIQRQQYIKNKAKLLYDYRYKVYYQIVLVLLSGTPLITGSLNISGFVQLIYCEHWRKDIDLSERWKKWTDSRKEKKVTSSEISRRYGYLKGYKSLDKANINIYYRSRLYTSFPKLMDLTDDEGIPLKLIESNLWVKRKSTFALAKFYIDVDSKVLAEDQQTTRYIISTSLSFAVGLTLVSAISVAFLESDYYTDTIAQGFYWYCC
ncbi:uncharacterized protein EAF02_000214 [Botrytis sinoallii]|uniref:uncharacterized protein n=1 Tax=Botrytis sinoallii TaxID=1463999 RepID=UPI001902A68B|nr:uncharacterized protein EAF02_000214 [Botrytis sinoallii]KAF7892676.1 hypothetical protein EAF02_000214 [Botrytis sinoallii]